MSRAKLPEFANGDPDRYPTYRRRSFDVKAHQVDLIDVDETLKFCSSFHQKLIPDHDLPEDQFSVNVPAMMPRLRQTMSSTGSWMTELDLALAPFANPENGYGPKVAVSHGSWIVCHVCDSGVRVQVLSDEVFRRDYEAVDE